jgi:hypothetical protein
MWRKVAGSCEGGIEGRGSFQQGRLGFRRVSCARHARRSVGVISVSQVYFFPSCVILFPIPIFSSKPGRLDRLDGMDELGPLSPVRVAFPDPLRRSSCNVARSQFSFPF